MMMELTTLTKVFEGIGQYGFPICMVVYFMYRDHEREKRAVVKENNMILRIQGLEGELRSLLMDLVTKTSGIIVANSEAWLRGMSTLQSRPCLADELAKKMLAEMVQIIKEARDDKST
jgi:hypothetical protein